MIFESEQSDWFTKFKISMKHVITRFVTYMFIDTFKLL